MSTFSGSVEIARRDWLKAASLTGITALTGVRALAEEGSASPPRKVRGVVFMVSDGMSPGVMTLAEAYSKLTRKKGTQWWQLFNNPSSVRGLMDTASANSMVTDSAAASSAWGSGNRVNNGAINISPAGKSLTPIAVVLKKNPNTRIGLVTTATVTHATPAGFAAAVAKRSDEADIAPQYLNRADVILGGGSGFFSSNERKDKKDLSAEFIKAGYDVVKDRKGLLSSKSPRLLGTFTKGHLPFAMDRDRNPKMQEEIPTLQEMATAALSRFLETDGPFLLQVEGARIDHAAHLNDIAGLLGEQLAFDDAVAAVLAMTTNRNDILVVVTSDHGNSNPGLNGMGDGYAESSQRFERITRMKSSFERVLAEWGGIKKCDPKKLTQLIQTHLDFKLKPGEAEALCDVFAKEPIVEWNHQLEKPEGLLGQIAGNHTGIGWTGTTHTSDPTLISAIGPQQERFSGIVTNSNVFGHFVDLLG